LGYGTPAHRCSRKTAPDITARKQAEEARERLLAAEQAARAEAEAARQQVSNTLERISDAFGALDRDWRYTYVNEKAAQIFKRCRASCSASTFGRSFPKESARSFIWRTNEPLPRRRRSKSKNSIHLTIAGSKTASIRRRTASRSHSTISPNAMRTDSK
jgi:PAS domain-containing protein